jgi:hypothetical protein
MRTWSIQRHNVVALAPKLPSLKTSQAKKAVQVMHQSESQKCATKSPPFSTCLDVVDSFSTFAAQYHKTSNAIGKVREHMQGVREKYRRKRKADDEETESELSEEEEWHEMEVQSGRGVKRRIKTGCWAI